MPKVSVATKGCAPDSSDFTAFKRRQAILRSQLAKSPPEDPNKKPIVGREFHLQKGFESGIVQWKFMRGAVIGQDRFN